MAKVFEAITPELGEFIASQPLFFVASAPLDGAGHVNLSPRGYATLRVLGPLAVAYLDLTGSGNETAAHLAENGRITLMFCAFSQPPMILRLYGRGRVVLPDTADWPALAAHFDLLPGTRQIIVVDVERVQTSCGYGVPLLELQAPRDTLLRWAEAKGAAGLTEYRALKNSHSIDGLPAPQPITPPEPSE